MLTHKQTQFAVPTMTPEGWQLPPPDVMGNCFATCVACLLELDPGIVPNFAAARGDWWAAFQDWLGERGFFAIEVICNYEKPYIWTLPGDVECIVNGKSPRGEHNHSVIAKTVAVEGAIRDHQFIYVHDPHPSNDFVQEPIYSITFLVRR